LDRRQAAAEQRQLGMRRQADMLISLQREWRLRQQARPHADLSVAEETDWQQWQVSGELKAT
jgi:hypothetical protein